MLEGIVTGTIQGIAEWLPISSDGMITLVEVYWFGKSGIEDILLFALFLHLGTFFAALTYFRVEVLHLLTTLLTYPKSSATDKNVLHFLVVSTLISGALGFAVLLGIREFEQGIELSGRALTAVVGVMLLVTAWLQLRKKSAAGRRTAGEVTLVDSLILGVAQGLAVLPGLSRSGLTVSALLLRNVEDEAALRLSFLMSLPIVFLGNIVLNFEMLHPSTITATGLWGLAFSFIFGLATIHILIKFARRVNFGYFVGVFGVLMLLAAII